MSEAKLYKRWRSDFTEDERNLHLAWKRGYEKERMEKNPTYHKIRMRRNLLNYLERKKAPSACVA